MNLGYFKKSGREGGGGGGLNCSCRSGMFKISIGNYMLLSVIRE